VKRLSTEQHLKCQRGHSANDRADDCADKRVSPAPGGKSFCLHPLAFFAGLIFGAALVLLLELLLMIGE